MSAAASRSPLACDPVIKAEVVASTDEEQGEQHDEIGGSELNAVIEDYQAAVFGDPAVVGLCLQDCLGLIEAFDGTLGTFGGKGAGALGNRQPAVRQVHAYGSYNHGDHEGD